MSLSFRTSRRGYPYLHCTHILASVCALTAVAAVALDITVFFVDLSEVCTRCMKESPYWRTFCGEVKYLLRRSFGRIPEFGGWLLACLPACLHGLLPSSLPSALLLL